MELMIQAVELLIIVLQDEFPALTATPQDIWKSLNKESIQNECKHESNGNPIDNSGIARSTSICPSGDAEPASQDSH